MKKILAIMIIAHLVIMIIAYLVKNVNIKLRKNKKGFKPFLYIV